MTARNIYIAKKVAPFSLNVNLAYRDFLHHSEGATLLAL